MTVRHLNRRQRLREIEEHIGRRTLIWFGTRGSDAHALLEYPQFTDCFSLVAPLEALYLQRDVSLEQIRRHRVDLNNYNTDADTSEEADKLHRALCRACGVPSVLVTYRPSAFLASVYFSRAETVTYLGMFNERLAAFEHKPWVESALRRIFEHETGTQPVSRNVGVRAVPWRYLADEDVDVIADLLRSGPQVLRANHSSGGVGLRLVRDMDQLPTHWPAHRDRFLAVAPLLEPNVPLNINACVFPDGGVTFHAPSLQLIGIPSCTGRTFGYCGNDFARVRELGDAVLDALEEMTLLVGKWLHRMGYLGVFGIDALLYEGALYLAEINSRFQGSSAVAAELARQMDLPDLFADHVAAFLGLESPPPVRVRELARAQAPVAQVICYNRSLHTVERRRDASRADLTLEPLLLPRPGISVAPEAMLFKVVVPGPITEDGQSIAGDWRRRIEALTSEQFVGGTGADPIEGVG